MHVNRDDETYKGEGFKGSIIYLIRSFRRQPDANISRLVKVHADLERAAVDHQAYSVILREFYVNTSCKGLGQSCSKRVDLLRSQLSHNFRRSRGRKFASSIRKQFSFDVSIPLLSISVSVLERTIAIRRILFKV